MIYVKGWFPICTSHALHADVSCIANTMATVCVAFLYPSFQYGRQEQQQQRPEGQDGGPPGGGGARVFV